MTPSSIAGMAGCGMVWPPMYISQAGQSRMMPSVKPMYQSGWDPAETCGIVGAVVPDRVGLEQASHQGQRPEHHGEHAATVQGEHRHDPHLDHVALGASGAGELGVLLVPHQGQVGGDQGQQDARDEQHVLDVEPVEDDGAGELAPKTSQLIHEPTTGMASMIEEVIRSPVPDSRSSGRK